MAGRPWVEVEVIVKARVRLDGMYAGQPIVTADYIQIVQRDVADWSTSAALRLASLMMRGNQSGQPHELPRSFELTDADVVWLEEPLYARLVRLPLLPEPYRRIVALRERGDGVREVGLRIDYGTIKRLQVLDDVPAVAVDKLLRTFEPARSRRGDQ